MARQKYPANCPWDLGPGQKQAHQNEWTLVNGDQFVSIEPPIMYSENSELPNFSEEN